MNIGFSTTLPIAPTQVEPQAHKAAVSPDTEGAESRRPVEAAADTRAGSPERNSTESEKKERKPLEGSDEAKREALKDPNSALFKELQELKKRDREVRTHEQAHLAAAGSHARGGPFYEFQRGPDGQRYAVSGHVKIDTSEVPGDPEATLRKAEVIRRAALAPAEPSSQDRSVAAKASSMAVEARQEIAQLRLEEVKQSTTESASNGSDSSPESGNNAAEDKRSDLEGRIRETGAVSEPTPVLDLVA